MKVLFEHPDVHDAAVAAARETAQKLKGLERTRSDNWQEEDRKGTTDDVSKA